MKAFLNLLSSRERNQSGEVERPKTCDPWIQKTGCLDPPIGNKMTSRQRQQMNL